MFDSSSFTYDPRWGVSIDEYLDSNHQYSLVKYPLDRVRSAIKTVTTSDPPGIISDATFEAVLSIAYYPEHLSLLDVAFSIPMYEMFDEYLNHHFMVSISVYTTSSVIHTHMASWLLERSFGVLLMQVHESLPWSSSSWFTINSRPLSNP